MDKVLRPARLETDPNSSEASKEWFHWKRTFDNFLPVCCECRPQFHRSENVPLIKATQPFERINIDFKGRLPTNNGNKYFLMVVDEYSRFPFFSHVLTCLRTQSLSVLHRCSHLLECQHMSIQTA